MPDDRFAIVSGLARAMVQHGLLSEHDAGALHAQAQAANIGFVEQILLTKKMTSMQVAMFASRVFCVPLLDLNGFDLEQINKEWVDPKIVRTRRVLPLYKCGNRLFIAVSDPTNLQALNELRFGFKTNFAVEPVVVEDDKLERAIARVIETMDVSLDTLVGVGNLGDILLDENGNDPSGEENPDVDDAPVVKYIHKIMLDAISTGVSDIHFEPYETVLPDPLPP